MPLIKYYSFIMKKGLYKLSLDDISAYLNQKGLTPQIDASLF